MKKTSRAKRSSLAPNYCEVPGCAYEKFVQRHRILPGREGGKYVLGNVIALCPNCHAEADNDLLSRDELYRIVTERIARDATRHLEGGTRSDTAQWLGFADEPATSSGTCWADVQDGNIFVHAGRSVVAAVETFRTRSIKSRTS